jgi:hypothetical protein
MITQQAIGCKLDCDILAALKAEAAASGRKSNRIINDAITLYVNWVDMCRRIGCGSAPNLEINSFYQEHRKYIL